MPEMMARIAQGAVRAAMLCALCLATASHADAQAESVRAILTQRLQEMDATLRRAQGAGQTPIAALLGAAGVSEGLIPTTSPAGPAPLKNGMVKARVAISNVDFALTVLAQGHGAGDTLPVIAAQGPRGSVALSFRGGSVTLADIQAGMRSTGLDPVAAPGDVVLRRPVVLWDDTTLRLDSRDHLALSRPDGAFIISLGRVEIDGSRLSVQGGPNPHSDSFVPFVTVAGGGSLHMAQARVEGLGFGTSPIFSGVSVVKHPLIPVAGETTVSDTLFADVASLSLVGQAGAQVTGNRFMDMRQNALLIDAGPGAQVTGNVFHGTAPTNAIRVLDASDKSRVSGNLLLDGHRVGIVVDGTSRHVTVSHNLVWRREGSAIKFRASDCGLVASNLVLENAQKGIEVRSSDGALLDRNVIVGSASAGVWVSGQQQDAVIWLKDNVMRGNWAGLSTATAARIVMSGNDLSAQFPRLFAGDIAGQTRAIYGNLKGAEDLTLAPSGTEPPIRMSTHACVTPGGS